MIFTAIFTAGICSALFIGAIYLLIWGDKPEPPTWEKYLEDGFKKWRIKK